jgi:hypothetical protein
MSAMQRNKGASFEREVCLLLRDWTNKKFERNLEQSRSGGGDIIAGRYLIECKRAEKFCIPEWWRQAKCQAEKSGKVPVLITKRNREEILAIIPFSEFVRLAREEM